VKRQLRQEAGFGCCVCGLPIFQYHHIVEWSAENHNRSSDMMVLCPNHHDRATKGAFPEAAHRAAKAAPFNVQRGVVGGVLHVIQNYAAIGLGSVFVVNEGPVLEICGEEVLSLNLQDGVMLLSLVLRSESGDELCRIDRNEWVSGDPMAWDIEADYRELTIRERFGSINLQLNTKTIPAELSGEFWSSGHWVRIKPAGIHVGGRLISTLGIQNLAFAGTFLTVDENSIRLGMPESDIPGTGGVMVSWANRRERLWKTVAAWEDIKRKRGEGESG
jgi:hypothetical protein